MTFELEPNTEKKKKKKKKKKNYQCQKCYFDIRVGAQ